MSMYCSSYVSTECYMRTVYTIYTYIAVDLLVDELLSFFFQILSLNLLCVLCVHVTISSCMRCVYTVIIVVVLYALCIQCNCGL